MKRVQVEIAVPAWRENLDKVAAQIARDRIVKTASDKEEFFISRYNVLESLIRLQCFLW